jgi:O-succinylbenzoate synthase
MALASSLLKYQIERKKYFARSPLIVKHQQLFEREVGIITTHWQDGKILTSELSPLQGLSQESLDESIASTHQILQKINFETWNLRIPWQNIVLDKDFFSFLEHDDQCPPSTQLAIEWLLLNRISAVNVVQPPEHLFLGVNWHLQTNIDGLVKIKIGKIPKTEEVFNLLQFIKNNPKAILRLDANQTLNLKEWAYYLDKLPAHHIDYWEEPLLPNLWNTLPQDFHEAPVAFDEMLLSHGINLPYKPKNIIIRPSCCRGISGVIQLIHWAQLQHIGVTITSSYEGHVGMQALYWLGSYCNRNQLNFCGTNTLGQFL